MAGIIPEGCPMHAKYKSEPTADVAAVADSSTLDPVLPVASSPAEAPPAPDRPTVTPLGIIPEGCPMHAKYKSEPTADVAAVVDSSTPDPVLPVASSPAEALPDQPNVTPPGVIPDGCPMHAKSETPADISVVANTATPDPVLPVDQPMVTPPGEMIQPVTTSDVDAASDESVTLVQPVTGPQHQIVDPSTLLLPTESIEAEESSDMTPPGQTFIDKTTFSRGKTKANWVDLSEEMVQEGSHEELALNEVLLWEHFIGSDLDELKLLRSCAKPRGFSPKARFRGFMGWGFPFDRHDWIVSRKGREVRYVIDYYDLGDEHGYPTGENIECDVRPAFNSIDAIFYRAKAAVLRRVADVVHWWSPPAHHFDFDDSEESKT